MAREVYVLYQYPSRLAEWLACGCIGGVYILPWKQSEDYIGLNLGTICHVPYTKSVLMNFDMQS